MVHQTNILAQLSSLVLLKARTGGCLLNRAPLCLAVQEKVLRHAGELFEEGDTNHDGKLTSTELQALLIKVDVPCSFFPLAHIPA